MPAILPEPILRQVEHSVRTTGGIFCVFDIRALAADIRVRFPAEDIAITDIAATAIRLAVQNGVAVELSSLAER